MGVPGHHPNLTIWHNKIDCCMFVGVHCHQANLSLKIIRGGTDCYTIAMCAQAGHEDAMLSFRDASVEKIMRMFLELTCTDGDEHRTWSTEPVKFRIRH